MKNENQQGDTLSKGKEMGQKAFEEAKESTTHAIKALKTLIGDPIGGQKTALADLGGSNALRAGIVLIIIFAISCYLFGTSFILRGNTGVYFKLVLFSVIPSACIFCCYYLIGIIFRKKKKSLPACFFTTGVSVIPLALFFYCLTIFGTDALELLIAIGIFCLCTTILLINSSLQDIFKQSTRGSVLLTPAIVFITYFLSKVFLGMLIG